ncbi:hypothetical protein ITJ38_10505 [Agreia pratensis]|uniref:DUF6507 family protein n=1 Tax=Agreia pratensis TaxID=150121 RepID=UPI00188B3D3C|nr:DUF6507 family protein [Agreia pratensis]MBF4634832.1 hypothetical protein [Agreia pratensis]
MNGWRIVPEGLSKTLLDTQTAAEALGTSIASISTVEEPLTSGAGFDQVVLGAVSGFLDDQTSRLNGIMNRVSAGIAATGASAQVFLDGDEQIATALVASTETAAATGDITQFQAVLNG